MLPFDMINPVCIFLLGITGVVTIASVEDAAKWYSQLIWFFIGGGLYMVVASMDYKIWLEKAHWLYIFSLMCLILLWSPLGERHYGCLRWLNFGIYTFQPSEIAKIGTLVMGASLLARTQIKNFSDSLAALWKFGWIFLCPFLLIFLQPDLGSAMILPPLAFGLLYVSGLSNRFFVAALGVFLCLLLILGLDIYGYCHYLEEHELNALEGVGLYEKESLVPLKDYQRNRILSFIVPEAIDPQGIGVGWNLKQSLIAIGSGGFYGKGSGEGMQSTLGYLPQSVAPNDFIFSVFAEERGFLGGLWVIMLYLILLFNTLKIAGNARDRFGILLGLGVSIIFMMHIFINVGMTIGLMPITGLPLPFISHGGSFVVTCCILQGLVQSIFRFKNYYFK